LGAATSSRRPELINWAVFDPTSQVLEVVPKGGKDGVAVVENDSPPSPTLALAQKRPEKEISLSGSFLEMEI
jgi:hypothetical protein